MARNGREKPYNKINGVIYPRHYFYRGGKSDAGWIISRMTVIPSDKQAEVSEEYERLYLAADNQARKRANTWLDGLAREYRRGVA